MLYVPVLCFSDFSMNFQVCFDKTGTLTEDGLDFHVVRPVMSAVNQEIQKVKLEKSNRTEFMGEMTELTSRNGLPFDGDLVKAIATCHSLTR